MFRIRLRSSAKRTHGRVSRIAKLLLKDEAISGKLLLIAALTAIVLVNSPFADQYTAFWLRDLSITIGSFTLEADLRHWINDGLMAIFFLVISLEIKRELVRGELRKIRAATLPIIAAIGGIVVPIAIYVLINKDFDASHGWGIPMTTDTAFAIGLLALLGRRVPVSLKIFLLTVMVVDDVAAILAIAIFYTASIETIPLIAAGGIFTLILLLHWLRFLRMRTFVALGVALWVAIYLSGIHASIAGVILGLMAPITLRHNNHKLSIAERLEENLIPFSIFVVIPLFALANAGVVLNFDVFSQESAQRAGIGVFLGLVFGKSIGITLAVWLGVKLRITSLPKQMTMHHIAGAALLSGVGFTLSIFIAELAFGATGTIISATKLSIFSASIVSALAGLIYLRFVAKTPITRRRRTRRKIA